MIIREYLPSDCKYLADLFYQTVHSINARDYTDEQLNVWATGNVNIYEWDRSLSEHFTLVAMKDRIIVGFGDIDRTGYLVYQQADFCINCTAYFAICRVGLHFVPVRAEHVPLAHSTVDRRSHRYASFLRLAE